MSEATDEQLMLSMKAGDQGALTHLVQRYYDPLLGYLYRCTNQSALAEDLVQETFVILLKQTSYQADRPFKPWLYAIATNRMRNYFNSAQVRHAGDPVSETAYFETAGGQGDPQEQWLRQETGQEIAAAFAQLSEEYRITLILRFYADLSLQEIAQTLAVPLGTVKSRLSVGTRRLRDLLVEVKEGINR